MQNVIQNIPPRLILQNDDNWQAQYGAYDCLARYAGLRKAPETRAGVWQHGWFHEMANLHPEFIAGGNGQIIRNLSSNYKLWVFRKDQEIFLKESGIEYVKAIGAPIIYTSISNESKRIPNSLLVMPPHLTREMSWKYDEKNYVGYIKSLKNRFEFIAVCVGNADFIRNHWIQAFKEIGIQTISGADVMDRNSLNRMAYLFKAFEFVTMLESGSQLPYAAFFGAKVSIAGPSEKVDVTKLTEGAAFYRNFPKALEFSEYLKQKDIVEKMVGQFMVEPFDAVANEEWGKYQLGFDSKLLPHEIIKEMRWGIKDDLKRKLGNFKGRIYRFVP